MLFAVQLSSFKDTGCSEKLGDKILYLVGVNFRPVYQTNSCTISFLIQVPRMTNERKETCEQTPNFNRILNAFFCVSVFSHSMSYYIVMKMILPLKCSGSH